MYGETMNTTTDIEAGWGLSPHVRGNPAARVRVHVPQGSIPACTGKPSCTTVPDSTTAVYPRMYGETLRRTQTLVEVAGLSPHVRGNRPSWCCTASPPGSIPACTGKPHHVRRYRETGEVYPRMYGETPPCTCWTCDGRGLSPHVRGNRPGDRRRSALWGSIPACTGKPVGKVTVSFDGEVYPRMYGETPCPRNASLRIVGLSPHVRGNLHHATEDRVLRGSIPACTGKPPTGCCRSSTVTVYPRMYGETAVNLTGRDRWSGLSPHVRGNLFSKSGAAALAGSIPACTGKPPLRTLHPAGPQVYPRMYGETASTRRHDNGAVGLSPHVRGNPSPAIPSARAPGSIPACTGKPGARRRQALRHRVYPRMYGETPRFQSGEVMISGLSPHVRGNRVAVEIDRTGRRSIPACTGKPSAGHATPPYLQVYPRMYGETMKQPCRSSRVWGLSPHVRGNLCVKMTHS